MISWLLSVGSFKLVDFSLPQREKLIDVSFITISCLVHVHSIVMPCRGNLRVAFLSDSIFLICECI